MYDLKNEWIQESERSVKILNICGKIWNKADQQLIAEKEMLIKFAFLT